MYAASRARILTQPHTLSMSLHVWVAGPASTAYRRQLKQDQTAINIVADLISGDTQGAGAAIAQASASNDATGIASALTNAAALVSVLLATAIDLIDSHLCQPMLSH